MSPVQDLAKDNLGSILLKKGFISAEQLELALLRQKESRQKLGRTLMDLGILHCGQLVSALASQGHVEQIRVSDQCVVDPRVLQEIPRDTAERHQAVPLIRVGPILLVGTRDGKLSSERLRKMEVEFKSPVEAVPLPPGSDVREFLETAYATRRHRANRDSRIGEYLVREGMLAESELRKVLDLERRSGQRLGDLIVEQGLMRRDRFYEALAAHLGLPFVTLEQVRAAFRPEVGRIIPRAFAEHNQILPFSRDGDRVRVLVTGPVDDALRDFVPNAAGARHTDLFLTTMESLRSAIRETYEAPPDPAPGSVLEDVEVRPEPKGEMSPYTDTQVPRLINDLLFTALQRRASDIHIEQYENQVVTRLRVDGILRQLADAPVNMQNVRRVLTRLKLDCKLDISERRRPQDGSFLRRFGGQEREVDFRVAFQPTIYGENVIIRILDRSRALPTLEEIGFQQEILRKYERMIENPQGMILFTGPTGCGKTTSLYATLDLLRKRPIKIITAEDPVEYYFAGIQQCQVNEAIGNTFGRYLRGFLRQDPDVILVGEMRDPETAEFGVRAALTGHLVFTTLHTNDTIGTVRRLLNMGVAADMLAGSLLCVVSQRLVRTVCPHCKVAFRPPHEVTGELYPNGLPEGAEFMFGKGCPKCDHTGYLGRIPIFEFWELDEKAKDLIQRGADDSELRTHAVSSGMVTMVQDALAKAEQGKTTISELLEEIPYLQIAAHKRQVQKKT